MKFRQVFGAWFQYSSMVILPCSKKYIVIRQKKKTVRWTKLNFLGLLPECGEDQWHFPHNSKILYYYYYSGIPMCFEWLYHNMFWRLLDNTKAHDIAESFFMTLLITLAKKFNLVHQTVFLHKRVGAWAARMWGYLQDRPLHHINSLPLLSPEPPVSADH